MKIAGLGILLFIAAASTAEETDDIGIRAKQVCSDYRRTWELNVKKNLSVAIGTRVMIDMMEGAESGCKYGYAMGRMERKERVQ